MTVCQLLVPFCSVMRLGCALLCVIVLPASSASAYTSEDPLVQAMIKKGLENLEKGLKAKTAYPIDPFYSGGAGEHALAGYAYYKVTHDDDNPVVQQGLQSALRFVRTMSGNDPGGHASTTVYSAAVVTLLLAEVDRVKYRGELEALEKYFRRAQYRGGGYGYRGEPLGDISQTQYAILALWTLDHAGMIIDYEGVAKTVNFLLRVQDPSGGWPYMGKEPRGGQRMRQDGVSLTMAYAGGSALLIAADILQLWGEKGGDSTDITGMPKAVSLFREGMENQAVKRPKLPVEPILSAISDCQSYIAKNSQVQVKWPYYNIYTIERYESFREVALKLEKKPGAAWYDSGVRFLQSDQAGGGGWKGGNSFVTESTATSFALLFLIRSTQKAIQQASSGATQGGWGLPEDTTAIKVEGTQIKGSAPANEVNDLLDMLSDDEGGGLEGKSIPEDLKLDPDPKKRAAQIDRLERLVRGSRSWQARRVAARLLGQSDEMRVVPTLIFALSDPDPAVPRYARDGLRFISRRFEGFGMPDKPNKSEVTQAQMQWREWYRKFNPGYVFIDYDL
ncbi:hypothetical protein [Novipirellula sp.]|uniref:hypothetical protein n=1 Tax=Novipirellula sp. TaxID=2795430 RepID=UPI003568D3A8